MHACRHELRDCVDAYHIQFAAAYSQYKKPENTVRVKWTLLPFSKFSKVATQQEYTVVIVFFPKNSFRIKVVQV